MKRSVWLVALSLVALAGSSPVAAVAATSGGPTSCTWTAVKPVTRSIATGGYSRFTGTAWYKIQTCSGTRTLSEVTQFKVVQQVTQTAYPGIKHILDAAYLVKDDISTPAWFNDTDYSCTDICTITHTYAINKTVPYGTGNQVYAYCRGCNAGGTGGESTTLYYITGKITCFGTGGAC